jgi:hypothetical protein
MASAKDTFESATFGGNSFSCGTWRGLGVTVQIIAFCVAAKEIFAPGLERGDIFSAGTIGPCDFPAGEVFGPGTKKGQVGCR